MHNMSKKIKGCLKHIIDILIKKQAVAITLIILHKKAMARQECSGGKSFHHRLESIGYGRKKELMRA